MQSSFDWAQRQVRDGILPTAVLGIATSKGISDVAAFGSSGSRVATTGDAYALFSITKPLVGLTALRAVERGLLALDAPLVGAIPGFTSPAVTLTHLLSHTSGVSEPQLDVAEGTRRALVESEQDFTPGTMTRYSTIAFEGVAALVESATGDSLDVNLASLASDAGMPGLTFERDCDPHPVFGAAEQDLDYERFVTLRHPGAGLFATAADLLGLGSALLRNDGAVVHPTTRDAMLRPLTAGLPKLAPYLVERGQDWGLGWNLRHSAPGLLERGVFGHGGWAGTEFWVYPELDLTFVLLTNVAVPGRLGFNADPLFNAVAAGR
ncbi:serine hydrolase domain-containing protein [Conyzicola nivalis]|uniref:Esterase n=1 Tax=Conyzicola nivalis TaxID=1477021 RepID=A0A916SM19_9MICO|nr:serine hydrolase domain-containing protein [Conyzicola nivalis]GGB07596.1 esterase [Conyzicola nivalis]